MLLSEVIMLPLLDQACYYKANNGFIRLLLSTSSLQNAENGHGLVPISQDH